MNIDKPTVVHVVAEDACPERLAVLRRLVAGLEGDLGHRVIRLGRAAPPFRDAETIQPVLESGWLKARMLSQTLARGPAALLHVWSPKALAWCPDGATLLVEVQSAAEVRLALRLLERRPGAGGVRIVCPTEALRRRLEHGGWPVDATVIVRDIVDEQALRAAQRPALRARLGWTPQNTVIAAVPPASRTAGTFVAAWAAMLLGELNPGVRLLLRDDGREAQRVARLAQAIQRAHLMEIVDESWTTAAMMQVADLAAFLPSSDAPLGGLARAMASGRPLVAADLPAIKEVLTDGVSARLCPPADPGVAARLLLRLIEQPEEAARLGRAAQVRARELFDARAVGAVYERVYAELVTGRQAVTVCGADR